MKARVNEHAWDGEWYVGYFDQDGTPLGSKQNKYGQIQLNGQTWAVISGFATPDRAQQALESAHRLLNTRHGLKLELARLQRLRSGLWRRDDVSAGRQGKWRHLPAHQSVGHHGERPHRQWRSGV